jgi:hypothetical protein
VFFLKKNHFFLKKTPQTAGFLFVATSLNAMEHVLKRQVLPE